MRPPTALLLRNQAAVRHTLCVWVPIVTNAALSAITPSLLFLSVIDLGYGAASALVVALWLGGLFALIFGLRSEREAATQMSRCESTA